jgi:hypothetical protein
MHNLIEQRKMQVNDSTTLKNVNFQHKIHVNRFMQHKTDFFLKKLSHESIHGFHEPICQGENQHFAIFSLNYDLTFQV